MMLTAVWDETLLNIACEVDKMEQLSEKVRELRKRMNWTQEDLARQIDVSLSTVQRWEGKGAKPTRIARKELKRFFRKVGLREGEEQQLL